MLTQIDVDSENAFVVPILGVTPKESILVRQITGLNPPPVQLFIGDYARDGGIYQGRRIGNRNIVVTMELNPNHALGETVSSLREKLYMAFVDPQVDADYIKMNLHESDGRIRYVVGYTETFETEIFSVDSLVQISIICPDPYIRDLAPTIHTHASGWTTVPYTYSGTAETGFETELHVHTPTTTLTLENNGKKLILTRQFNDGDVVYVRTTRGNRALLVANTADVTAAKLANPTYTLTDIWNYLLDEGLATSVLAHLTPQSIWLELHSQNNVTKVYGATTSNVVAAIKILSYVQAYWGV